MSIFQCDKCGCAENTALVWYPRGTALDGADNEPRTLCSACAPLEYPDGTATGHTGEWHGRFPRRYYPKGAMGTGPDGNLCHRTSGRESSEFWESPTEYPDDIEELLEKVITCGFECVAGPLVRNVQWKQLVTQLRMQKHGGAPKKPAATKPRKSRQSRQQRRKSAHKAGRK
jgi:hypothetical protein